MKLSIGNIKSWKSRTNFYNKALPKSYVERKKKPDIMFSFSFDLSKRCSDLLKQPEISLKVIDSRYQVIRFQVIPMLHANLSYTCVIDKFFNPSHPVHLRSL